MRVCLSTWGSRGDVEPMAALARQLRESGAEVRMCAPPDFAELADRAGAELVPKGQSIREMLHGAKPLTPADAPRVAAALIAMQFDTVAPAAQDCDAIVATGLMPAGVRSVAEVLGIAYVCVAFMPGVLPSPHQTPLPRPGKPFAAGETDSRVLWDIDAERVNALYREPLNVRRTALGLPPVVNVRDHVHTDRPWLAADPVLAPWPGAPDLDVVQTGAWILPDDRPLPADVLAFLDAGAPPVYVSMGSVRVAPDTARVAVEALRAHGCRIIVGRGWAGLTPIGEADDCLTVDEINYQSLFPRLAAVVHHGGAGTTTAAARAGTPQVVVPQIADQPYWAGRVAALGIGTAHDGAPPTVESLSEALGGALSPDVRARAAEMAAQIRSDGARVAAEMLMELAETHSSR